MHSRRVPTQMSFVSRLASRWNSWMMMMMMMIMKQISALFRTRGHRAHQSLSCITDNHWCHSLVTCSRFTIVLQPCFTMHHDCYVSTETVYAYRLMLQVSVTMSAQLSLTLKYFLLLQLITWLATDYRCKHPLDHQMSRKLQSRVKAAIWSWWSTERSWTSSVSLLFTTAHHQYTDHFRHCCALRVLTADK